VPEPAPRSTTALDGSSLTRRSVLAAGLSTGALATLPLAAGAADAAVPGPVGGPMPRGGLLPDLDFHLARRCSYGLTPALRSQVRALGYDGWLDEQLALGGGSDPVADRVVAAYPRVNWSIAQVRSRPDSVPEFGWEVMMDLGQVTIGRAAFSRFQLFESMCEFWSDHLHVTCPSGDVWDSRADYERTVIRRHAFGRFSDMLVASFKHPAMLVYLDNAHSTKEHPNENYGRELLELHTLGVVAGYDQSDVVDANRLLTGHTVWWSWELPDGDARAGTYRFDPSMHWTGAVDILGWRRTTSTTSGPADAEAFLRWLALHPRTAARIARKLSIRFVSDNPPQSLVDRLASTYLANGSSIRPVLKALFTSAEFKAAIGTKVRRPLEDLVATVRALGLQPSTDPTKLREGLSALYWQSSELSHAPKAWDPPNGYPDVALAWQSASGQLGRWNMHVMLGAGWWPNRTTLTGPDPSDGRAWLASFGYRIKVLGVDTSVVAEATTYTTFIQVVAARLLGQPLDRPRLGAVLTFFGRAGSDPLREWDEIYRWGFWRLLALVLDTPQFGVR